MFIFIFSAWLNLVSNQPSHNMCNRSAAKHKSVMLFCRELLLSTKQIIWIPTFEVNSLCMYQRTGQTLGKILPVKGLKQFKDMGRLLPIWHGKATKQKGHVNFPQEPAALATLQLQALSLCGWKNEEFIWSWRRKADRGPHRIMHYTSIDCTVHVMGK